MLPVLFLAATATSPKLYQICSFGSFSSGHYDGARPISDLRQHGDFGLGAFDRLDGEMIVLDGVVNRVSGFGDVTQPSGNTRTPFGFVTKFKADRTLNITRPLSPAALKALIDHEIGDPNAMVAIRIDGRYSGLQARSFAPLSKPYLPFARILDRQSLFPYGDAAGTFVGFRMPKSAAPINVPGYHFHFLTADHKHGGHVLGYQSVAGTVQLMKVSRIDLVGR
jgi:acetolactate decarboxylase